MSPKRLSAESKQIRIRLDQINYDYAMSRAKESRFSTLGKYVGWLLWRERTGADTPTAQLEEKLSKTLLELRQEIRTVHTSAEGTNAMLVALAKMLLVTLPEAQGEEKLQLQAVAKKRFDKLLTVAGQELAHRLEDEEADAAAQ
jgi:hypothetical protein